MAPSVLFARKSGEQRSQSFGHVESSEPHTWIQSCAPRIPLTTSSTCSTGAVRNFLDRACPHRLDAKRRQVCHSQPGSATHRTNPSSAWKPLNLAFRFGAARHVRRWPPFAAQGPFATFWTEHALPGWTPNGAMCAIRLSGATLGGPRPPFNKRKKASCSMFPISNQTYVIVGLPVCGARRG